MSQSTNSTASTESAESIVSAESTISNAVSTESSISNAESSEPAESAVSTNKPTVSTEFRKIFTTDNSISNPLSRMFKIANVSSKSEYHNYLDEIRKKLIVNHNIIDTDSRSLSPYTYSIKFTSLDSSIVNNAQGSSS